MDKTPELLSLIKQCQSIIKKYKTDDPILWSDIEKQIQLIIDKKGKLNAEDRESISFGPLIARYYDNQAEKAEMQALYTLYYMVQIS